MQDFHRGFAPFKEGWRFKRKLTLLENSHLPPKSSKNKKWRWMLAYSHVPCVFFVFIPSAKRQKVQEVLTNLNPKLWWHVLGPENAQRPYISVYVYIHTYIYICSRVTRPSSQDPLLGRDTCGAEGDYPGNANSLRYSNLWVSLTDVPWRQTCIRLLFLRVPPPCPTLWGELEVNPFCKFFPSST